MSVALSGTGVHSFSAIIRWAARRLLTYASGAITTAILFVIGAAFYSYVWPAPPPILPFAPPEVVQTPLPKEEPPLPKEDRLISSGGAASGVVGVGRDALGPSPIVPDQVRGAPIFDPTNQFVGIVRTLINPHSPDAVILVEGELSATLRDPRGRGSLTGYLPAIIHFKNIEWSESNGQIRGILTPAALAEIQAGSKAQGSADTPPRITPKR